MKSRSHHHTIPFCRNPECPNHSHPPKNTPWYHKFGFYPTNAFNSVQRFRCLACGITFSTQTFSLDYFAKRKLDYRRLFLGIVTCTSIRDLSRIFACSTGTIANKTTRLARQMEALHGELFFRLGIREPYVIDGFENFAVSQYFPNSITLLAGKSSQFLYDFSYTTLRRKGRMTESQKSRRKTLESRWKDDHPATLSFCFLSLLRTIFLLSPHRYPIRIHSDEHPVYRGVLRSSPFFRDLSDSGMIIHERTSGKAARTVGNPLFSVNYLDRELRKQLKECVRQTICFGRNVNNVMDRMAVYRGYYNYFKPYRQTAPWTTHAQEAGIGKQDLKAMLRRVFTRRMFYSKVRHVLLPNDMLIWFRRLTTPLKTASEYVPAYAFM